MNEGFNKTYDALREGHFLWRPRRKTETPTEYVGKRDKAIMELYNKIQPPNNTIVDDNELHLEKEVIKEFLKPNKSDDGK